MSVYSITLTAAVVLDTDWKLVEKIAALLEESLSPSARVQHNVKLPVVGAPHRTRQCDVVITYGEPPRQTITIVEVQKRTRKPELTTFHGWVKKMQQVGAQHLICVSVRGYPDSIIEAVRTEYGPTVRLLTLEELQQQTIRNLDFVIPYALYNKPQVAIETIGPMILENLLPDSVPTLRQDFVKDEKLYEVEGEERILALTDLLTPALLQIADAFYQKGQIEPARYKTEIDLVQFRKNLWFRYCGKRYKVRALTVKLEVENRIYELPLVCYAYHQEFIDDTLAWVASANGVFDGKDVQLRVVFKPNEVGFLHPVSIAFQGMYRLRLFFSPNREQTLTSISQHYPENQRNEVLVVPFFFPKGAK